MFRKLCATLLILVMCTSLLITGCSQSQSQPGSSASTATSGKIYELKFSTFLQEGEKNSQVAKYWIEQVEQKTNGQVKITPFWGESFASHNEHPSLVASGALDIAMFAPNIFISEMPLNALVAYNISNGYTREQMVDAAEKLMFDNPDTAKILQSEEQRLNIKFLAPQVLGCEGCIAAKPFNTLADMKGWKVTSEGGMDSIWSNLGLVPVMVNVPDLYESYSRSVVDTVHLLTVPITQMNLSEISKCYREWENFYMLGLPITVNLDLWNSLPADIQDIFIQASKDAATLSIDLDKKAIDTAWQTMKDAGVDVGYFSAEDTAKFVQGNKDVTVNQIWTDYTVTLNCADDGKVLLENWEKLLTK